MNKALLILLSATVLASCAHLSPTSTPPPPQPRATAEAAWYPTHLYRGLRVVAGTVNQIDWSRTSFGVSGAPPNLSLFNNMANAAAYPCWLRVTVDVPGNPPPQPLVVGDLTIPNPPPGGANAGPWPVLFDNVPPGHWSIAKATIGGASNNAAGDRAAAVFAAMAQAPLPTAVIRDGSAVGCH